MTSHFQRTKNYAAEVILHIPNTSNITKHLISHHWHSVKERSTYKIACLCNHSHSSTAPSYVADMLQQKPSHTTLAPAYTPCLYSIDLCTVRRRFVIAHFPLLLLLSGTPFQMMSGVPHHCHHLCLISSPTYLILHTKTTLIILITIHMCIAWQSYRFFSSSFLSKMR